MSRDIHIIDIPKIPENLRKCQYCSSNEIESEIHFENVFHAPLQLTNDMKLKYAGFDSYHLKTKLFFFSIQTRRAKRQTFPLSKDLQQIYYYKIPFIL